MDTKSGTRSIRVYERANEILNTIPEKKGISINRFINECIIAHNAPTSRKVKDYKASQILALTNLGMLRMSQDYEELPEDFKQVCTLIEKGLADHDSFKGRYGKR